MKKTTVMCAFVISCFSTTVQGIPRFDADQKSLKTIEKKPTQDPTRWLGWWITTGLGASLKPKPTMPQPGESTSPVGFVGTVGIKWQKGFKSRWCFSPALLWGVFLPDMFIHKTDFEINFGIFKITIPYNWALLLPITSLQFGYTTDANLYCSMGLVYFYAVDFNVSYPVSKQWALTAKLCVFTDKVFLNHGIHLGFLTVGLDWRLPCSRPATK